MAVIASPKAAGPGDVLAVLASNTKGWKVVDRELIEAALQEEHFSKPWLDGTHRLSALGASCAYALPHRNSRVITLEQLQAGC